ncbi:MFS transporter [Streptomyces sp. NPDC007851]|uniref:MFS transporter n=1 Tax=Streptomyces sp. NPDC007851 TaxID=3155008 RepID=UPI0033DC2973
METQQSTQAAAPAVSLAPADAPPVRAVWLAAWPLTAVFMLSNAATPLYVLWRHELGFSAGMLTVIFACYIIGLIAALVVAGVASDRIGRKPVLLPALVLAIVASVLFATAASVLVLVVARLLAGIAVGSVISAGMAAVTDVAGPQRRRLAALLASAAIVVGAGVGPLLAGILSETLPGPTVTVFEIEIVLLALAVLVVWRMPLPGPTGSRTGAWIRIPSVPRPQRRELLLGIAVFLPGLASTSYVLSLGPSLLADVLGTTSRIVSGATTFVTFAAATAVQFSVQRLRIRSILLMSAISVVAAMAVLVAAVYASSAVLLVVAAVLAGTGHGLGQLGGVTLITSSISADRLAEANAALNIGVYLPVGLLSVGLGYLSDAVGLSTATTAFGATIVLAALAGATFAVTHRRTAN